MPSFTVIKNRGDSPQRDHTDTRKACEDDPACAAYCYSDDENKHSSCLINDFSVSLERNVHYCPGYSYTWQCYKKGTGGGANSERDVADDADNDADNDAVGLWPLLSLVGVVLVLVGRYARRKLRRLAQRGGGEVQEQARTPQSAQATVIVVPAAQPPPPPPQYTPAVAPAQAVQVAVPATDGAEAGESSQPP